MFKSVEGYESMRIKEIFQYFMVFPNSLFKFAVLTSAI